METLNETRIDYKNTRVTLSKMNSGRYFISNGCEPLGFAETYSEACQIFDKKVKAFRAKRTRELNKLRESVARDFYSIDRDLLLDHLKKEFCMNQDDARIFYEFVTELATATRK